MQLSAEEARVLACLIEKETTVPDSYPLTLNALRFDSSMHSKRGSHSIGAISADGPLTFVEPETVMDVHATQEPQR